MNRNQIGAIVGSQPFGGEGLSGTGPKAGGPFYLRRLQRGPAEPAAGGRRRGPRSRRRRWPRRWRRSTPGPGRRGATGWRRCAPRWGRPAGWCGAALAAAEALPQAPLDLPGPTGESNRLSLHPRGRVLCLGAGAEVVLAQAVQALAAGNAVLAVAAGAPWALAALEGVPVAAHRRAGGARRASRTCPTWRWSRRPGRTDWLRALRRALSRRGGPIVPLVTGVDRRRALLPRAASLHRHHGGRRQRQPAGRDRLMALAAPPRRHAPDAARAPRAGRRSSR